MSFLICRRLLMQQPTRNNFRSISLYCFNCQQKSSNEKFSREKVKSQVEKYFFTRFFDYVSNYDKLLEKKFPSAVHVYRVFLVGVKDFYNDMKKYLKITRIANGSLLGLRSLTRKELELYYQMPLDMLKVAPVLLVSALPFANYVVFPVAYMYPRLFLTHHFWTSQQKLSFNQIFLQNRLEYNLKVYRCLQSKLGIIYQDESYEKWKCILGLLGSGLHPTADEILMVNEIFTTKPYHLDYLSAKHVNYLCHLHGIHRGWLQRYRLAERSYIIHHMDLAIKREGGVHNMTTQSLTDACFLRGLNSADMNNDEMIKWLEEWVKVSLKIDGSNISLFLHLPILIGYNHPNNWKLIYCK